MCMQFCKPLQEVYQVPKIYPWSPGTTDPVSEVLQKSVLTPSVLEPGEVDTCNVSARVGTCWWQVDGQAVRKEVDFAFAPEVYGGFLGPLHVSEGGNAKEKRPPDRYTVEWGSTQDKGPAYLDVAMHRNNWLCTACGSHEAPSWISSHCRPSVRV